LVVAARGIVLAALAAAALVAFVSAPVAAPMCRNGICVEVEPFGNPVLVHFRVTAKCGKSSFEVLQNSRRKTVKGGQLIHVPCGAKSTVVGISHCFASTLGIPQCTRFEEFVLAGFSGQRSEQNADRCGGDYRRFETPIQRYRSCLESCEADGRYKAYIYVRAGVQ
jgi:hypothetical protein